MAYSELGEFFSLGRGSDNKENSHFFLLHESQALALLGFEEDMTYLIKRVLIESVFVTVRPSQLIPLKSSHELLILNPIPASIHANQSHKTDLEVGRVRRPVVAIINK